MWLLLLQLLLLPLLLPLVLLVIEVIGATGTVLASATVIGICVAMIGVRAIGIMLSIGAVRVAIVVNIVGVTL